MAKIEYRPILEADAGAICPHCEREIKKVGHFEQTRAIRVKVVQAEEAAVSFARAQACIPDPPRNQSCSSFLRLIRCVRAHQEVCLTEYTDSLTEQCRGHEC